MRQVQDRRQPTAPLGRHQSLARAWISTAKVDAPITFLMMPTTILTRTRMVRSVVCGHEPLVSTLYPVSDLRRTFSVRRRSLRVVRKIKIRLSIASASLFHVPRGSEPGVSHAHFFRGVLATPATVHGISYYEILLPLRESISAYPWASATLKCLLP